LLPPSSALIALMTEAASTSEMSVKFYQTTWCINPQDSHLHTCCHENLKSHMRILILEAHIPNHKLEIFIANNALKFGFLYINLKK
jgi:hypothetical protein